MLCDHSYYVIFPSSCLKTPPCKQQHYSPRQRAHVGQLTTQQQAHRAPPNNWHHSLGSNSFAPPPRALELGASGGDYGHDVPGRGASGLPPTSFAAPPTSAAQYGTSIASAANVRGGPPQGGEVTESPRGGGNAEMVGGGRWQLGPGRWQQQDEMQRAPPQQHQHQQQRDRDDARSAVVPPTGGSPNVGIMGGNWPGSVHAAGGAGNPTVRRRLSFRRRSSPL